MRAQKIKRDLDATVLNPLLSTVLKLHNVRGALLIFLCLRRVVNELDPTERAKPADYHFINVLLLQQ